MKALQYQILFVGLTLISLILVGVDARVMIFSGFIYTGTICLFLALADESPLSVLTGKLKRRY